METSSTTSKVFNLTDVSTPTLVQYGLVGQTIVVGNRTCAPGQFVDVPKTPDLLVVLEHLLRVGAVAVDQLPPPYQRARAQAEAAAGGKPSNAPAHLDVQETKVTDPGPQQPPAPEAQVEVVAEAVPAEEPKPSRRK